MLLLHSSQLATKALDLLRGIGLRSQRLPVLEMLAPTANLLRTHIQLPSHLDDRTARPVSEADRLALELLAESPP